MMRRTLVLFVCLVSSIPVLAAPPFVFRDVGEEAGLFPALTGIAGHGAAWGDIDNDGWVDLYVGTFHKPGTKPNLLLRNSKGKLALESPTATAISSRATGILLVDLDNDGDLDLYVASMPQPGRLLRGCSLFRNDGGGKFTDVSNDNGACPLAFGGRSATAFDYDGDGLLDLLVGEDPAANYNGSPTASSRLFRNLGKLEFEDVSRKVGLPVNVPGLGVAVGDVNNDGRPDFFLSSHRGGNILFLNEGGKFKECPGSRKLFAWDIPAGGDNMIAGVCLGDVNRDGLLDIVIGQHFEAPWKSPVPIRLYLNRGIKDGLPTFEDVTDKVGLKPLPMKAPHVEIQDFDNDGWPDIYTSIVKFADGKPHPVIFRGLGIKDGLPQFREEALAVNDFPTDKDRAIGRSGDLFAKVLKEKTIFYSAPGPSADFDNDGRLDLFLASWWPEAKSLLLKNETPGGHWLQVQVEGGMGVNRMGIGARILVYPAGKLGESKSLIGCREIATGFGYASGQPAIAHFGLGKIDSVDVRLELPHGKGVMNEKNLAVDRRIVIK
ncbi:MAG: CRTAC1 family protein [Gemmataceae bacterium]|nr:CRTAC1 family protein [Gemmataceae bacterium]